VSTSYLVLVLYKEDDHKHFWQNLHINPEENTVFASDGLQNQLPVNKQLVIIFFHFGHYRNAVSVEAIAQWAGVSAGMVINVTRQMMLAFLVFHDTVVQWPSMQEREEVKEWVEATTCA
jgi:hypothetical protein